MEYLAHHGGGANSVSRALEKRALPHALQNLRPAEPSSRLMGGAVRHVEWSRSMFDRLMRGRNLDSDSVKRCL